MVSSALFLFATPALAQSQMALCEIAPPAYDIGADTLDVTVTLTCGESGTELEIGKDMVIGMTIYSDQFLEDDLRVVGTMPVSPTALKWRVLGDEYAYHHDFELQQVQLTKAAEEMEFTFSAPIDSVVDQKYLLTVIWSLNAKEDCDASEMSARQGCRDYGYVVGADLDSLLIAYPGIVEMMSTDNTEQPKTVPRWVVEQFR